MFHLLDVAHRVLVRRVRADACCPRYQDVVDALQAVRYNLGLAKERPRMDRYTWEEKVEYWSLVWGTIVMIATGFMLWNPIATARFLPGEFIPAAQVVHGGEALLAILAVLVWHFYSVHLRHFNRSMFTGQMTEHEMEEEHPLELERIRAGEHVAAEPRRRSPARAAGVPADGRRRRASLLLAGLYWFVTFEQTAITTLPPTSPGADDRSEGLGTRTGKRSAGDEDRRRPGAELRRQRPALGEDLEPDAPRRPAPGPNGRPGCLPDTRTPSRRRSTAP